MRRLSDTISRLSSLRASLPAAADGPSRLDELSGFGSNPGQLRGWTYAPEGSEGDAALVVVLHGCTQTAAGYDHGAGWSQLADRHGFALLFPEQQRSNNANLCFNWFEPGDTARGSGEALSIRQMIAALIERGGIDPARVFVTGLSAGGAMTSVMLATYPEVFAGGAIIAGLPYGTAGSVPEAFDRMRGHGGPDGRELAALVRRASDHAGAWPTVSIWHGSADRTVDSVNALAIAEQWRGVHGLAENARRTDTVSGHSRHSWSDGDGRALVQYYSVAGMGHGTPLKTSGGDSCGTAGAHMLEAGISSTTQIARSWGLVPQGETRPQPIVVPPGAVAVRPVQKEALKAERLSAAPKAPIGVAKVIDDALRAAGLVR